MERLIKTSGKIWHVCTMVGGFFMAFSALLIVVNVILRRFFNAPIFGSTEMVQYLGLAITSFAIVENEWGDGNIVMSLFVDRLPRRAHNILSAVEFFIEAIVFAVVDFLIYNDVVAKIARGNLTSELRFPKWIPSMIVLVGFVLLTIVLFVKGILYVMAAKKNEEINFEKIGRVG